MDPAALVRALAEGGLDAARRLIRDAATNDRTLADRIAALREHLRRQAARRVRRLMDDYDAKKETLEVVSRSESERLAADRAALEARLAESRRIDLSKLSDASFADLVEPALLLPDASWLSPEKRPGIGARIAAFFRRLIEWLKGLFGRRKRVPARARRDRRVPLLVAHSDGRHLTPSEIGDALARMSSAEESELRQNISRTAAARERDLERAAETKRKEFERQRRSLDEEKEEARKRAERETEERVKRGEEDRVKRELKERGLLAERNGELAVTYSLVERFARIVLQEESTRLPGDVRLSLTGTASTGVYEKARLRQPEEVAHLDIPGSLLAARLEGSHHIDERSSYIYREVTSERVHVVLAFDRSGSMAEGTKLLAAKRAFLALYVAIRRRYPDAVIDVLAFDNDVSVLDLVELWELKPGAFTNTGEALHTAHLLLRASRATRKEVYLVTDGLPEAFTDTDGRVKSGNLATALERALDRARELSTIPGLKFSIVLIRSTNPAFEEAARAIAKTVDGELVVTDPDRLGIELLVRWARGTESVRKPIAPSTPVVPAARPPPGPPQPKRRRADRRMGG